MISIDLAEQLKIDPQRIEEHLLVEKGDLIEPGMALARKRIWRFLERRVYAGVRGTLVGYAKGSLFVKEQTESEPICAHIPGEVIEVCEGSSVTIQNTGALVQGIWGRGGQGQGTLAVVARTPETALEWNHFDLRYRGMILVSGTLQTPRALWRAANFGIKGIVAGSLHPDLSAVCEQLPFPVIITEGMGAMPMAPPIFELLQSHHGHMAVLTGGQDATESTPELIIPLVADNETIALDAPRALEAGNLVRLTGTALIGTVAKIESIPDEPQETDLGHLVWGAYVRLANRQRLFVPLANMERLT